MFCISTSPLRGLSVGAPVTFFGLPVGEVTDVGLTFDPATLRYAPARGHHLLPRASHCALALAGQESAGQTLERSREKRQALLRRLVEERGLRAQLRSGSLLTGQLYVAFDYFPKAPKARVDWNGKEPELPVVPSLLPDVEAEAHQHPGEARQAAARGDRRRVSRTTWQPWTRR